MAGLRRVTQSQWLKVERYLNYVIKDKLLKHLQRCLCALNYIVTGMQTSSMDLSHEINLFRSMTLIAISFGHSEK